MSTKDKPSNQALVGHQIGLTPEEIDAFLASSRTCRVATVNSTGPHVSPLWFVWHGQTLWLYSIVASRRIKDLQGDNRVAVVIDDGYEIPELRGVEIIGLATVVGETPRTGDKHVDELVEVERHFARKYQGREELRHDGRHAWLRIDTVQLVSWHFGRTTAR